MKNVKVLLLLLLTGIFIFQSCQKEAVDFDRFSTEQEAETRIWPLVIAAAVTIIVELSEGQWYKKTNSDGSSEEGCDGVGNCGNHSTVQGGSGNGTGLGADDDLEYTGDYSSEAFVAINETTGHVIFGMNENADPETKDKFFYGEQIYVSPSKTIDNPAVLDALELSEPVFMEEGFYEVFEYEETKYIIIQE